MICENTFSLGKLDDNYQGPINKQVIIWREKHESINHHCDIMIFLTLQQCFAVDSCIYGKIITTIRTPVIPIGSMIRLAHQISPTDNISATRPSSHDTGVPLVWRRHTGMMEWDITMSAMSPSPLPEL